MMKNSVYIETTIVSYLSANLSRDIVVAAHQQITNEWWANVRQQLDCFISPFVIWESEKGDREASNRRLKLLSELKVLELNAEIQEIAEIYFKKLKIPDKAQLDAAHLAVACWHKIDYILTWNCKHIANGRIRKELDLINKELQLFSPVICTPEELMEI